MSQWLTLLADRIKRQYSDTPSGHAVRINGLEVADARDLCIKLRQSLPSTWDVLVVAEHPQSELEVICDIAIQRRNDKSKSRLFIVPSAFVAEAAASLADTDFHDVTEFLKPICDRLYRRLSPDVQSIVKEAMLRIPVSMRLDFLCALPDSDVTAEHCGKEFWRLGLIPDAAPSIESISINRSCVNKISDSVRLGTSIHQKVDALGLGDPVLKDDLTDLLRTSSLVQSKEWLEKIGQNDSMTFDKWTFPGKERINLKGIDVLSFRDSKKNKAYAWSGLALEEDTLKVSIADTKAKVTVRWTTQPLEPSGEVIYEISLETSEPNPVPLPAAGTQRHKATKTQTWSFRPSDLDELEEGSLRVRVVVRAYSADTDDFVIGESDEFLLVSDDVEISEQTAIPLIRSIPDFFLDRATKTSAIPELTQALYDGPASIKIELDERQQKRIPINPLLYSAQRILLNNPNNAGALSLNLPCDVRWNDSHLKFCDELLVQETLSREWWQIRRKLFAKISESCSSKGVLEAVELSEMSDDILTYCRAYANALKNLQESGSNGNSPQLNCLIHLDSILLKRENALVGSLLSPLHPLRLLWHLMHESLIKDWIRTSLDTTTKCNLPAADIALELDGGNSPAFLGDEHSLLYHLDSPLFHWPLYISADEEDPHRLAAMVRWALGLGTLEALTLGQEVAAAALSEKLFAYRELHPYVKTLKVTSVNAGDGQFLVKALSNLADRDAKQSGVSDSEVGESAFEVRLYGPPPEHQIGSFLDECAAQRREPGLPRKLDRLFKPGVNFLQPHLFWAKRDLAELEDASKSELEEAHVSFVMEYFKPDADLVEDDTTDSAGGVSCYGLQTDLAGELAIVDDKLTWFRSAKPPEAARVAPHPVNKAYTAELLKVHRAILKGIVKLRNGSDKQWPASKVTIQAQQFNLFSRLHRASDWVLTVDRHLGVELFDSPFGGTGELQSNATRYLIDYAPDQIGGAGQQLMISTAWLEEVRGLLLECLREMSIAPSDLACEEILRLLKTASGRLVMRVARYPHVAKEAVSLAVVLELLRGTGKLENAFIVPIDDHIGLFGSAPRKKSDLDHRRPDLLLVSFPKKDTLAIEIIEVKYRRHKYMAYDNALWDDMNESTKAGERNFRQVFFPDQNERRLDLPLSRRKLAVTLGFYIKRAVRHGRLEKTAASKLQQMLEGLQREDTLLSVQHQGFIYCPELTLETEKHSVGEMEITLIGREAVPRYTSMHISDVGLVGPPIGFEEECISATSSDDPHDDSNPNLGNEAPGKQEAAPAPSITESPSYEVLLGVSSSTSPQFGILGEIGGRKVAIDLNQTHTISLFGVQGGGKSYTLGTIAEMASLQIPGINSLPQPLATVIFHYSPTMEYKPEFTSMLSPNTDKDQADQLVRRFGAKPQGLDDLLILVPANKLDERRAEYPGIQIEPLKFAASELQASHWRFLMGAVGNQATYIRQLNQIMRNLRNDLTLERFRHEVESSSLPDHLKELARVRLGLASEYIGDHGSIGILVRPGRLIIVDLRDEFIEKDEALGLFVVLLQIFSDAQFEGHPFNKLVVFDEAHKYIDSPDLVAGLIEVVREMRHKGTSIMVASQDPPSVPVSLIELSSQIILHRFNSPAWLKHIQKANAALSSLTPEKMAQLGPGEAYIWSSKATDPTFTRGSVKIKCRPRVTMHGGSTKTAVV